MFLDQYFREWKWNNFVGMWAYILHRISGIILALYLFVHIWITSNAAHNPEMFETIMVDLGNNPWIRLMEWFLFLAVIYHLLNGIRVIAIDWAPNWSKKHKAIAWWMVFAFLVLAGFGLFKMWHHIAPAFGL